MLIAATAVMAVLSLLIPTWLTPAESPTGRALSAPQGPAHRTARGAHLPATLGELHRDPAGDKWPTVPGQVDRALYVDAAGARATTVLAQTSDLTALDDYEKLTQMPGERFGQVSCGRRYDGLQCAMLLRGGLLSATTIDPAWQPDALAQVVRQAYATLPLQ